MKYLLILLVVFLAWKYFAKPKRRPRTPVETEVPHTRRLAMCAHCGVNAAEEDGVMIGGRFYCCEAHSRADAAPGR